MGHVGLTPQSATMLGGFKTQGKTAEAALRLVDDARALEAAGCFSVVLEAVPPPGSARNTPGPSRPATRVGGRAGSGAPGRCLPAPARASAGATSRVREWYRRTSLAS